MPPQYCVGVYQPFGGCGFREDHTLPVYSSSDLVRWRYEGDALPFDARPRGIYFRPKVIFDARSGDYVLWINYLRQSPRSAFPAGNTPLQSYMSNISTIVAKARSPRGPFAVVNPWARLQVAHVGDFALIVGRDGTSAYIAYDAWDNGHRVRVERLNDAWTETLSMDATDARSTSGDVSEADVEAPILFERRGWYYLIYGSTCCFCAEGGSAVVMAAREPLGPWRRVGNINPWNEETGCGRPVPTQNNFVATVATAAGDVEYLFMGDLWTTAPDGLKSHDLQYWAPLRFDDGESTYRGSTRRRRSSRSSGAMGSSWTWRAPRRRRRARRYRPLSDGEWAAQNPGQPAVVLALGNLRGVAARAHCGRRGGGRRGVRAVLPGVLQTPVGGAAALIMNLSE